MWFVLKDGEPFYFAGTWDRFKKSIGKENPFSEAYMRQTRVVSVE